MALALSGGFKTSVTKRRAKMSQPDLLKELDIRKALPLWELDASKKKIAREFIFQDFQHAFTFMTRCAQYAEEIDHHPDWSNSWNKVFVELTTHSLGALSQLDIKLALAMDRFAQEAKD